MANNIVWDVEAIKKAGTELAGHADDMFDILKRAAQAVEGTKHCFSSAEGDKTRQRFQELSQEFSAFHQDVQAFAAYIEDYGAGAAGLKSAVSSAAAKLPAGNR